MRTLITIVVALVTVAATGAPTYAATTVVDDGADTPGSSADIRKMKVKHNLDRVVVRTTYTDLRKVTDDRFSSTAIFIDSKRKRRGPELALVSGLQHGTDYQLVRVKGWRIIDKRVDCGYSFKIRWARKLTTLRLDRECFAKAATVRVSQKTAEQSNASDLIVDWAPGKRAYSPWVSVD